MWFVARTREALKSHFEKCISEQGATNIVYNHEYTPDNPHNHWLFELEKTKDALSKQWTRYRKLNGIDVNVNDSKIAVLLKEVNYKLYLCKGYNVSLKQGIGVNSPEPPRVIGLPQSEVMKLHKEFWKNNAKKKKQLGKSTQTHFHLFREYIEQIDYHESLKEGLTEKEALQLSSPELRLHYLYVRMCKEKGLMMQKREYVERMIGSIMNIKDVFFSFDSVDYVVRHQFKF